MNFILKNAKLSVLALLICFGFTACDEEDDFQFEDDVTVNPDPTDDVVEANTIVDFADANGFTSLVAALEAANLTATLDGDTEYTVFAPTDDAFAAFLTANGFASLDEVPEDVLELILLNHVQTGSILSTDLTTGYITSTAEAGPDGENVSLFINTDGGVTINGVSTVTSADNIVDNGVVHAVDAVIGLPDVTTFATADPTFSILVQALTREDDYNYVAADGTGILQTSGDSPAPFTVFAPTDDAFMALLDELGMAGLDDIPADLLAKVLNYHVVTDANVVAGDLTDEMEVTTFESGTFTIFLGDNVTIVDENNRTTTIILTDVQATNGVIHAIDRVLLPEDDAFTPDNSIADFAANNENYSSLFAALRAANLDSVLDGDDEFTVFAPDNDAFAAFLSDMGFASLDEVPVDVLEQVLLNHVQAGSLTAGDLATGYYTSSATAGPDGENLSLYINTDGGVTLNGVSTVTTADVMVDNGVIHAVDAVIGLPDITTFALADPTFSILVDALTREDSYTFVEILQSADTNAPFTVFAPTNAAFADLLTDLELAALADIDADVLSEVLSYHVITEANATSSTLTEGMTITTFQGENVTINVGDNVTVTDVSGGVATVVLADVQATNGVIHAIDMVLLPTLDD